METCYEGVLNDDEIFKSMEEGDNLNTYYSYLLFVQVYTMLTYYFHWFIKVGLGRKG